MSIPKSPKEKFLLGRASACRCLPYLESCIIAMGYAVDPKAVDNNGNPTIVVTSKAQILAHPEAIDKIVANGGIKALGFIIAHEAFHVLLGHPKRGLKILTRDNAPRKDLLGLAADLSINPTLKKASELIKAGVMSISPPTGSMAGAFPEKYGLKDGLTLEMYYSLLKKKYPKEEDVPGNSGGPGDGCMPVPADSPDLSDSAQELSDAPETGGWTDSRTERMQQTAQEKAKKHEEQNRGSVPAGLLLELDDAAGPPKVDWRDALMAILFHHAEHRAGADEGVWFKPSRRQAGLGMGPGSPRMPGLVEYSPTVGVVLDTSGSMGGYLKTCVDEILGLCSFLGGAVEIVYCDTVATEGGKVENLRDIAGKITGGGGTDMNDALDRLIKKNVDVGVCLTDGYIGPPGDNRGYPLIWVLTPDGGEHDIQPSIDAGWASMVRIDKEIG